MRRGLDECRKLVLRLDLGDLFCLAYWLAVLVLKLLFVPYRAGWQWSSYYNVSRLLALDATFIVLLVGVGLLVSHMDLRSRLLAKAPVYTASVLAAFTSLGYFIRDINPDDYESLLVASDRLLLGGTVGELTEQWALAPLTDFLQVCYSSLYFLPVVLFAFLIAKGRNEDACRFAAMALAVMSSSYLLYILVPARSPYVIAEDPATAHLVSFAGPIPAGRIARALSSWLHAAEKNRYDCFPSGHTQLSLTVLLAAWMYARKTFPAFLVVVLGLIAGTLYLRYHYVIDVVVGAAFAIAIVVWVPRLNDVWLRLREENLGRMVPLFPRAARTPQRAKW